MISDYLLLHKFTKMHTVDSIDKVTLEAFDQYLEKYTGYLNDQYESVNFMASERKVPKTENLIVFNVSNKIKLQEIIIKDSFNIYDVSEYELLEFLSNKECEEIKYLIE